MANVQRANRTIEDRARFGLGTDTQDDNTAPATDETDLGAEGVLEAGAISDPEIAAAEVINASYRPLWSTLTADSADVNNDATTLVASGLSVTVGVGTYVVEALLPYTTAAAADIQIKFGGTATVTATVGTSDLYFVNAPGGDATAASVPVRFGTSWTTAQTVATTGALAANNPLFVKGTLVVTVAGTIAITFAQGTADVSNTHIDSGAYLKLEKVA